MLNDASGFKRIYIACGQTDLRRGIEGLATIIRFQFKLDPMIRILSSCSAERRIIESRGCSGKAMDFFSYTRDWK